MAQLVIPVLGYLFQGDAKTMDVLINFISSGRMVEIGLLILGLAILWLIVRFALRLTIKIFASGCFLILLIGLCVFAFRLMSGS